MIRSNFFYVSVFAVFLFVACNSNDKTVAPPASDQNSIQSLKNQIKQHPDSLMLKENLIEAYRNAGYYDSALAVANQEILKDSGSAYLWNIKASLYFESGDTMQAINSLKRAIDIYPLPDYLVALGTVYAEIKNPKCLAIADELLKANKAKSGKDAFFIKGLYYNYINEPKNAIPLLDSCLALDFTYMYAYREKAIALYTEKKYEEAIKVLKRAVTIQNNFDEGYYWLGKCYEKLNKKDQAIQSYQNALLYDNDYIEARQALNGLQATR
jgi:tetratricopeptide (TPR) repeat protein